MNTARETVAVILAAGKGTRMKSDLPKVLHPLLGKPMVSYVIEACKKAGSTKTILVIGHGAEKVRETFGDSYEYAEQTEQLGTGHALMMAKPNLENVKGDLLVLAGDTPFLTGEILQALIDKQKETGAAATMLTAIMDPAGAYGRIVRDSQGNVSSIVEARDCTPDQLEITEVNTSHYCFDAEKVLPLLDQLSTDNDQGEYYLTDVIHLLVAQNEKIETITSDDPNVLMGINNRLHLAEANEILRKQLVEKWCLEGVSIIDPSSVHLETDVEIATDTVIYAGTMLTGNTKIEAGCTLGPNVRIKDSKIGEGCHVEFAVVENREIPAGTTIGPFASLTVDE